MPEKTVRYIIAIIAALALLDGAVWREIASRASFERNAALYFLNVGQGDSELIVLPGGVKILVDGGRPNGRALAALARILPAHDRYLDIVLMTHPQLDHFGGLIDVVRRYDIGVFVWSGRGGDIAAYRELSRALEERAVRAVAVGEGDTVRHGSAFISVLSPDSVRAGSKELNDTSIVFMLEMDGFRALYTGDIGSKIEQDLAAAHDLSAQVLKVPHHGSRFSSGNAFLRAVDPEIAVIGVGKNSYGHPAHETVRRLLEAGARVFRTDREGNIRVERRGNRIEISAAP